MTEQREYVDWGSGEVLAMAALDQYPVEDGLPKSTSVVFRIHQLGHAREQAEASHARLIAALREYGRHHATCDSLSFDYDDENERMLPKAKCSCGFSALLSPATEPTP